MDGAAFRKVDACLYARSHASISTSDRIGGRPTGSPACERAIDWSLAKFKSIGVDAAYTEAYTLPYKWVPVSAEARCLSPAEFPVRVVAAPGTPSTSGTLEAPLVYAGDGSPEAFAKLGATTLLCESPAVAAPAPPPQPPRDCGAGCLT